jgi:7-carboxy-7-deazaguanine synthase
MNNKLSLRINEIFFSIQGESSHAGRPCIFIRLTYCNLRCTWCDTTYSYFEGTEMTFDEIMERIVEYDCRLVEVTGGEPLVQENVRSFMSKLCDAGYEVLLETGGHMDISGIDNRIRRIMDIKCPSSGESQKNRWNNISHLTEGDEVKFVVGDRNDYEWAKEIIKKYGLTSCCTVLFSPVFGTMDNRTLAEWILEDALPVRFQMQLHKYIWEPGKRGV